MGLFQHKKNIHFTDEQMVAMEAAAESVGMPLTEWIRFACAAACGRPELHKQAQAALTAQQQAQAARARKARGG